MQPSLTSPTRLGSEEPLELSLRPQSFQEYVGQEPIKQSLQIAIQAARERTSTLDHLLLYGPPGLGKTSLATLIAKEMEGNLRTTSGPALTKPGDLAAILTNLQQGDIFFIDEIHRLPRTVEEILYPAMEDSCLDLLLGKGPSARSVRLDLPHFTLVGATTQAGSLSQPLRERFGLIHRLEFYEDSELAAILSRSCSLLRLDADPDALLRLAQSSRKTPRVANRLLRRVRDYAQVHRYSRITKEVIEEVLKSLGIDSLGLDILDRRLLDALYRQFNGGPAGLDTLAAITGEEVQTIEDVVEPYLLRLGFIDRTPRGRVLTPAAQQYLNVTP